MWCIYTLSSLLPHKHWENRMITAMTMMRSWAIWFKSIKARTGCMFLGYALDINSWLLHPYSNAMWDSLRLKSLTIRVFVQKYDKANSKDDIKDLHYWLFEKGTPPVTAGFPSQRSSNAESMSSTWSNRSNDTLSSILINLHVGSIEFHKASCAYCCILYETIPCTEGVAALVHIIFVEHISMVDSTFQLYPTS